jgi:hypothetical protein
LPERLEALELLHAELRGVLQIVRILDLLHRVDQRLDLRLGQLVLEVGDALGADLPMDREMMNRRVDRLRVGLGEDLGCARRLPKELRRTL